MRKTLFSIAILLALIVPHCAVAQFIGYVSPQTVQQTLATNLACTGSSQTFAINNLGQTQHYLSVSSVSGATQFTAIIQGIDNQGNTYTISDPLKILAGHSGSVLASGYFPKIQVSVTCVGASPTFSASYSGAWSTPNVDAGTYLTAQIDKVNFSGLSEAANQVDQFQTPFGSSLGTIWFQYSAAGAGGTLTISCSGALAGVTVQTFTLANSNGLQDFQVPDTACPTVEVSYANNGTTGTISGEYIFAKPGAIRPAYQYQFLATVSATEIKAAPGFLHAVHVTTGAAGTVALFDLPTASCTGTPSTNQIALITATTTTVVSLPFDVNFVNGLCVKASSASIDFTVSYQ